MAVSTLNVNPDRADIDGMTRFWSADRASELGDESWQVMNDPEGNVFCVCRH